jgi:FkbM family methyltransferase
MRSILRNLAASLLPGRTPPPQAGPALSARHEGHHAIFDRYEAFSGDMAEGFSYGFLGDRFRAGFGDWGVPPAGHATLPPPPIDEEYFEWTDILEAAAEATGVFTFLELGAGFGRWSVRAALAARQLGKRVRLGVAEPDPRHVSYIRTNMADNGVSEADYGLYEAAVGGSEREMVFCVGKPDHGGGWYGQSIVGDEVGDSPQMGEYFGHPLYAYQGGWAHVLKLRQITLSAILADYAHVDLIDLDLQAFEAEAVQEAIAPLTVKVRRLHIGTHGEDIEDQLRETLSKAGWTLLRDYRCRRVNETDFGPCEFNDGVQSWINPRFS